MASYLLTRGAVFFLRSS